MTTTPRALPPTIIAVATYVIVAGIFTQSGVILGPAAAYFHSSVADAAGLFAYLNAGNLGGIAAAFFCFPALSIRQALFVAYIVFFAGVAVAATAHDLHVASLGTALIGFGAGTGLSVGAVIISKTYTDRRRAIAFLSTDCAFSAAGYVFPGFVALVLAAGWRWQTGYLLVSVLPAILLVAASWIRFPPVARTAKTEQTPRPAPASGSSYARVFLFALALAFYLTGQNTFTIWSPNELQTQFGISALQAGGIIGTFFGASSLGLITAAALVTKIPPRVLLPVSMTLAVGLTLCLTRATTVASFFGLTAAFGFTSTCMFKLMISIGSEQIPSSPPQLVTLLLLCSGLGGIAAPALSAPIVRAFGAHASLYLCSASYAAACAFMVSALIVERRARRATAAASLSASAA